MKLLGKKTLMYLFHFVPLFFREKTITELLMNTLSSLKNIFFAKDIYLQLTTPFPCPSLSVSLLPPSYPQGVDVLYRWPHVKSNAISHKVTISLIFSISMFKDPLLRTYMEQYLQLQLIMTTSGTADLGTTVVASTLVRLNGRSVHG